MIQREQWLAALAAADVEDAYPDAVTAHDFAVLMAWGKDRARDRLNQMVQRGRARLVRKRFRDITGRWQYAPAYLLLEAPMSDARDDRDTLDGAETEVPDVHVEPTDDDLCARRPVPPQSHGRLGQNPRPRRRAVSKVRRVQPRPRR